MCEVSGELIVILITIWWLQKIGKFWQEVNKHHRILMRKDLISRKLNELDVRKQYQFAISNRFAALENFSDMTWENIRGSIKTSVKESLGLQGLKQHKPWFAEEYLGFCRSKGAG
jgi:nitrogen fixation-related uncharacterized protein